MIKDFIKSIFGSVSEARENRKKTAINIAITDELLQMDGEDKWFLNICREKSGEKECLPDD